MGRKRHGPKRGTISGRGSGNRRERQVTERRRESEAETKRRCPHGASWDAPCSECFRGKPPAKE